MEQEEKKEGMVRDLIEKKRKGEITSKEILQEIQNRGLQHGQYGHSWIMILCMIGWGILCFISVIVKIIDVSMLGPFTQLPAIKFQPIIKDLAAIFALSGLIIGVFATYLRAKKGGTGWKGESETIIMIKEGPYRIIRHPAALGLCGFMILLTVYLSEYVPFNILSVIGNILLYLGNYYCHLAEEKLNTLKWGDKYRQYMKEVPRFNFIFGIWRHFKTERRNLINSE